MSLSDNILIIIRSVNERTALACHDLIAQVVPSDNVKVITEAPFSKALRACLDMGINSRFAWVGCVDADVLISKERVKEFLSLTDSAPENVFCLQSLILDKFFFIVRPSGIHLYRVAFARQATSLIPEEGTSLRPESHMLRSMAKAGYAYVQCDIVVGIHDYEQYYSDIYRKSFLQAHKHSKYIKDVLPHWQRLSGIDVDFKIAMEGLKSGNNYRGQILVDKRFVMQEISQVFNTMGLTEKECLNSANIPDAETIIQDYFESSRWRDLQNKMFPKVRWNEFVDQNFITQHGAKVLSFRQRIVTKFARGLNKLRNLLDTSQKY